VLQFAFTGCLTLGLLAASTGNGAILSWNAGDGIWDGVGGLKWFPAFTGPPAAGDDAVLGDRVVAADATVTLGANTPALNRLDVTGGVDLLTGGFNGESVTTVLSGAGSRLVVESGGDFDNTDGATNVTVGSLLLVESGGNYDAGELTLTTGGDVQLTGGRLGVRRNSGNGFVNIQSGSEISGWGTIEFRDNGVITGDLLTNDGAIRTSRPLLDIGQRLELTVDVTDTGEGDPFVNLDGITEAGTVSLAGMTTLSVLGTLTDDFSSTMDMSAGSILHVSQPWALDSGAVVDVDAVQFPTFFSTVATIEGAQLTARSNSTINVQEGKLELDADFVAQSGSHLNVMDHSTLQLDGTSTINDAETIDLDHAATRLVIGGSTTIRDTSGTFDWDGLGNADHAVTEVGEGASLNLDVAQFDSNANPLQYDGTLNIDGGTVDVRVGNSDNTPWVMDRTLNLNNTNGNPAMLSGNPVELGNGSGALDAVVNVAGGGVSRIAADVRTLSDTAVDIAAGATLDLDGAAEWAGGQFQGGGVLDVGVTNTVSASTTIGIPGTYTLTVDLDEGSWRIESGAALTIHAAALDATDLGVDTNITIENGGSLTVQLPSDAAWHYELGDLHYQGDAALDTFLAGDPVELKHQAVLNIDGSGRIAARVDLGGDVHINDAGRQLQLTGGTLANPNRLTARTIDGAGELSLPGGKSLVGHGTVDVDVVGAGQLRADDGTLHVNGAVTGLTVLGTADADGVLNLGTSFSTSNLTGALELRGGEVTGAVVLTNDAGTIRGHGRIGTNTLNNYGAVEASGGTLVIDTANASQLDGSSPHNGEGVLRAVDGNLEIASNVSTTFNGLVDIGSGRKFAMTQPGSLFRNAPASEDDDGSGDFGRVVIAGGTLATDTLQQASRLQAVGAATSTLQVAHLTLEGSSFTEIVDSAGELQLTGKTVVKPTANVVGMGTLVNQSTAALTIEDSAVVGVPVRNAGALHIGNSPGRARALDYTQTSTGRLEIELAGLLAGTQFDVLDLSPISGIANLDGTLDVSLLGGFVPAIGDRFEIVRAPGGVVGTFGMELLPALPIGSRWEVRYQANDVTLGVVVGFAADFDEDGDVDGDDLAAWESGYGASSGVVLGDGDADADADVDGTDLLTWQRQFGAGGSPAIAAVTSVPEPSAVWLLMVAALALPSGRGLVIDRVLAGRSRPRLRRSA
jgi:hypothetical protein